MARVKISDFIPYGKENAITRSELSRRSGLCDRDVREYIALERRHTAILNDQDGKGYYKPLPDDYKHVKRHYEQETHRGRSIFWSLRGEREWLKENSVN